MARKVFVSFLGMGNYIDCIYTINNKESTVVTYVQNAIIELLADDYDEYLIFCTKSASEKHFENIQKESGKILKRIDIADGASEDEIWRIFETVYAQLREKDEVIYDITHSFRSLPMLGITLLQYAKFLKKIVVNGIFYGAFEALGSPLEIKENFPEPMDRKVPLFDLTAFSLLQDWAIAANNFINLGNAKMMEELTRQSVTPILSESKGKDYAAMNLRRLSQHLQQFSEDHRTNRGLSILEAKSAMEATKIMNEIEDFTLIPPFKPIVNQIKRTLEQYSENDTNNILKGVEWCIERQLVQEGLTQLQEGVVTILAFKINCKIDDLKKREMISSYLSVRFVIEEKEWKGELTEEKNKKYIQHLDSIKSIKEIAGCYDAITKKRNDINHGGYISMTKSSDFLKTLKVNYQEIKQYLNQ